MNKKEFIALSGSLYVEELKQSLLNNIVEFGVVNIEDVVLHNSEEVERLTLLVQQYGILGFDRYYYYKQGDAECNQDANVYIAWTP